MLFEYKLKLIAECFDKSNTKLCVHFSGEGTECTGRCEELEDTLASIREDVVEAVNAWVVRTHSPTLAVQYGLIGKVVSWWC